MQPTGVPHLGNYLGALRWWVADQGVGEAFYFIADLHALTQPRDPAELREATMTMATSLLAIGLDPGTCTIFAQSHVPEHAQLAWLLSCTASMGELQRMTQFKDKAAKGGVESARVGLFTYPVLQAADILLYQVTHVPVGEDQRQHLELARTVAERFNHRYGPTFVVPDAAIPPPGRGARVMDLQVPTAKMSKSAGSEAGLISILDPPEVIERRIKRAVTDTEDGPGAVRWDPESKPGVSNLLQLLAAATGGDPASLAGSYSRYGDLKADTAAAVVELLAPIRARYAALAADPGAVWEVLRAGSERARAVSSVTLERATRAVGLLPAAPPA